MKFIDLPESVQRDFIRNFSARADIPEQVIEKDWWVSAVLRALFCLPSAPATSFKGGTSLSKCWNLISRFSEDIDIAITREYLGYSGVLSKTQVSDKLRRAACSFVRDKLQYQLRDKMIDQGVREEAFRIEVRITPITTTDPEIIYIHYKSVFEKLPYIKTCVKVEVSGRSMNEPLEMIKLSSMLEGEYPQSPFVEDGFDVAVVKPERTFIEKICLLHEEFSKSSENIRVDRMSRHLYDVALISGTPIAERALNDKNLFDAVVEHRRKFIGLKGFDYSTLAPKTLNIIPPQQVMPLWRADYEKMQRDMIYGQAPSFDEIIKTITELNRRIALI